MHFEPFAPSDCHQCTRLGACLKAVEKAFDEDTKQLLFCVIYNYKLSFANQSSVYSAVDITFGWQTILQMSGNFGAENHAQA